MKKNYAVLPGYILDSRLSCCEKILCGVIDGFAKEYGTCDIGNEKIAEILDAKVRNVEVFISALYKKAVISNRGTKFNRKLVLNYVDFPEIEDIEVPKTDAKQLFETLWEHEPKKEAKEAAKKYFLKLSHKQQSVVITARAVYLAEIKDLQYAVLLRTFIGEKYFLDDKYQNRAIPSKNTPEERDFIQFCEKALQLAAFASENLKILQLDFSKISKNEAAVFSMREVKCLTAAVGSIRGLVDQSYDENNIKSLLRAFWS